MVRKRTSNFVPSNKEEEEEDRKPWLVQMILFPGVTDTHTAILLRKGFCNNTASTLPCSAW